MNKINIASFLADTKKLIREGCPRKVTLQFQLFPIANFPDATLEQTYQLYHRHVHALVRILNEYRYKTSTRKQRLFEELIPSLTAWMLLSKHSRRQQRYLQRYLLQASLCVMQECKSYDQALQVMDLVQRFNGMRPPSNHGRLLLQYHCGLMHIKFGALERGLNVLKGLLVSFQLMLPSLSKSTVKPIFEVVSFTFLVMSIVYESSAPMRARECLHHCHWFARVLQPQLVTFLTGLMANFERKYATYIIEHAEINRVFNLVLGDGPVATQAPNTHIQDYITASLYAKYDYDRLNKNQIIAFVPPKTPVPISLSSSMVRSKRRTIFTKSAGTDSLYASLNSTVLPSSATHRQSVTHREITTQRDSVDMTEMGQFLRTFQWQEAVHVPTRKTATPRSRFNLDLVMGQLVTRKVDETNACQEYDVMSARMGSQHLTQRKVADKGQFGIKFLHSKRNAQKIYGGSSGELQHFQNRTKSKFENETRHFKDKIQARSIIASKHMHLQTEMSSVDQDLGLSPLKKAQTILLKHSNKLGLQNFKREHKRNASHPVPTKPTTIETLPDDLVLKDVQAKNTHVLKLLMDQYEREERIEVPTPVRSQRNIPTQCDLAASTMMNFVEAHFSRAAIQRNFGDMALAQYHVVNAKRLRKHSAV